MLLLLLKVVQAHQTYFNDTVETKDILSASHTDDARPIEI